MALWLPKLRVSVYIDLFIHSTLHLFLSTCYMPGTVPGTQDKRWENYIPALRSSHSSREDSEDSVKLNREEPIYMDQ